MSIKNPLEPNALEKTVLEKASDAYPMLRDAIQNSHIVERIATSTGTRTLMESARSNAREEASSTKKADVILTIELTSAQKAKLHFVNGDLHYVDSISYSQPLTPDGFERELGAKLAPSSTSAAGLSKVEAIASLVVSMALGDDQAPDRPSDKDRQRH